MNLAFEGWAMDYKTLQMNTTNQVCIQALKYVRFCESSGSSEGVCYGLKQPKNLLLISYGMFCFLIILGLCDHFSHCSCLHSSLLT